MLLDRLRGNPIDTPQAPRSILPDNISLEFQVLLSACRVFLGTEEPSSLKARLSQGPDWGRLLHLANRHGVMPLLYRSISKNCPQAVPQEWLRRLMLLYMQNAARNMKMTGELLRILDALEEAGIKAVPLKGPVLAEIAYGDIAMRQFGDLDILVAQVDTEESLSVLEKQGYRILDDPRKEISGKRKAALFKWMHHYGLINKNSGIHVELHWLLSSNLYGLNAQEASILEKAKTVNLLGKKVLCLCDEDLFVFLCQHGARHVWKRLSWLCEVARLAQDSNNNWSSILRLACRKENERILMLGLLLAKGFLDVQLPKEISQYQRTGIYDSLIKFSQLLMGRISLNEDNISESYEKLEDLIFYKNMFRSPLETVALYLHAATMPTKCDFAILSLPDSLFFAYYLVRPLRLLNEYGKAFWNNLMGPSRNQ